MKKVLLLCVLLLAGAAMYAQNDMKARIELEDAEKAYSEDRLDDALKHLDKTQELIGRWSHQIGYLRILSLDAMCDYGAGDGEDPMPLLPKIQKEVKLYMDYANKNPGNIERDRFREVYEVEDRVIAALQMAEDLKMPEYIEGKKAYDGKDYLKAMEWWKKAAEKGNAHAAYGVGVMYVQGKGTTPNPVEGRKWLLKATEKNNTQALYDMGRSYGYAINAISNNGLFEPIISELSLNSTAVEWYQKAANRGSARALSELGGVHKNNGSYEGARKYYQKAANKGSDVWMYLGRVYEKENNKTKALECYQICTNSDNVLDREFGWSYMGNLYEEENNYSKALECYQKACELTDYPSRNAIKIPKMYEEGRPGVPKNIEKAKEWYRKLAAKEGGDFNVEEVKKALQRLENTK